MNNGKVVTGIKKANVLPLPVLAAPSKSAPLRAMPMDSLWISVGSRYLLFSRPFMVRLHSGKSLKAFIWLESIASYLDTMSDTSVSIAFQVGTFFLKLGTNCSFFLLFFVSLAILDANSLRVYFAKSRKCSKSDKSLGI